MCIKATNNQMKMSNVHNELGKSMTVIYEILSMQPDTSTWEGIHDSYVSHLGKSWPVSLTKIINHIFCNIIIY